MSRQRALLVDITRCVGCGACTEACREQNGLPDVEDTDLSPNSFTVVQEKGDYYVRKLCRHCVNPTCASVCPVGAFTKTEEGPVIYDGTKCIGCRYCLMACPFEVPRYEWDKTAPLVSKCIMCYDRIKAGEQTACAEACPAGATTFGYRDELIEEAHRRIKESPGDYYNHVYGEHEVGGTNVLFLSPVKFEDLGFRTDLGTVALPELTWEVLKGLPNLVTAGGVALAGVWWLVNRRVTVDTLRHESGEKHPVKPQQSVTGKGGAE